MLKKGDILAGLDIGTTKICAIISEVDSNNELNIIGIGSSQSKGVKKGVIIDMEATVNSIIEAVDDAEDMAESEIYSVFTGLSGEHVRSLNKNGSVPITDGNYEITEEDVRKAIDDAKAFSLPVDRILIDYLPYEFRVDGNAGIFDPVGMSGVKLDVGVHMVTASLTVVQNIEKCIGRAGFDVEKIALQSIASGMAVLSDEEKEMGAVVIDIGGGTTDTAIFINKRVHYSSVLPLGGDNVTNDISIILKIPLPRAEEIKKKFGSAFSYNLDKKKTFALPGVIGRESKNLSVKDLASIIEVRMEEIFMIIKKNIEKTGLHHKIGSGIVLTGGGSLLKDLDKLAEKVFKVPVRIGKPMGIKGLKDILKNPIYASSVGLLKYGYLVKSQGRDKKILRKKNIFKKVLNKVKNFYKGGME